MKKPSKRAVTKWASDIIKLKQEYADRCELSKDICSISGLTPGIHMRDVRLFAQIMGLEITTHDREDSDYPTELSCDYMGHKFFSIHSEEELENETV